MAKTQICLEALSLPLVRTTAKNLEQNGFFVENIGGFDNKRGPLSWQPRKEDGALIGFTV